MLTAVVDRTGRGGVRMVRETFEAVERRLADEGFRLDRPVAAEIVSIPIMGASTSKADRHILHVSARAVASDMLDGLLAHETSHMLLTEAGHPSHDPAVLEAVSLPFPRAGREVFGQAVNHVQDVYADDIAFRTGIGDRAYGFFGGWIRGNAGMRGTARWPNVGLCVSNGFALGNLARHGLLAREDELWSVARSFDRDAGLAAVDGFAGFYQGLPLNPGPGPFRERIRRLVVLLQEAGDGREKARTF